MTTATTVLGLLPLAMGWGDGAELRAPMALTVISGLLSSTVLTLVVIPTLYAALDGLLARLRGEARDESPGEPSLSDLSGDRSGAVTW
jgi:HAE1 family hydrophobic/amphiphilic exporter-1